MRVVLVRIFRPASKDCVNTLLSSREQVIAIKLVNCDVRPKNHEAIAESVAGSSTYDICYIKHNGYITDGSDGNYRVSDNRQ